MLAEELGAKPAMGDGDHDQGDAQHEPVTSSTSDATEWADMGIVAGTVQFGEFDWTGNFTSLDLLAAAMSALNGALLCRRPDHFKRFTVVGVLLMALLGGIGGGITRDVLVRDVPVALTNPAYITICLMAGMVEYRLTYARGQLFREGLFELVTSFSLTL